MNQRLRAGEAVDALRAAGIHIVREHTGDGSEVQCRCPNHPDPDGHLYVNAATGAAFCHRCKHSTNLAALCGHERKVVPAEELVRQNVLAVTAAYYHSRLFAAQAGPQARHALRYLTDERALPLEIVKRFQAGWAEGGLMRHLLDEKGFSLDACLNAVVLKRHDDGQVRDFFYRRIVFPNVVGGRVVHLSARIIGDGKPKWLHLPGEITHLYNGDAVRHSGSLLLEGILDVLSSEAWDHHAAACLGTHIKPEWFSDFPQDHRINVCLDGDSAGEAGAIEIAETLGLRARIVTLPPGTDPNDLLREGRRTEFEACLKEAQDLLTFQINRIPADMPKTELPDHLAPVLARLATLDPARAEAYLGLIKTRFSLNREEVAAYRKMVTELRISHNQLSAASKPTPEEAKLTALFDGLVDLVEQDGQPAFLIREGGELHVMATVERDGEMLAPPPPDQIPWLLPRAEEVLRACREDSDAALYDDLVAYHQGISELPSEAHCHLIAAWDLHTYVLESAQYSPELCFHSAPERGKTRTGKGMVYVAYRPIHVESLRDPYIVRFAANFGGTIFFDVRNLWNKAEKMGSDDILLGRFERGITVPRVNWPERGPHQDTAYYPIFGPTIIGTNEAIHHILDTRAVTITMPQSRRKFEADVTPEAARPLRERLVAFRARHLGEALPELEKPAPGRLGDILKPLVQVVRLARPEKEAVLRGLVAELQGDRLADKADTLEAEILRIMDGLRQKVVGGVLPVQPVTDALNEDRPVEKRISPQRVGKRLKSLGFQSGTRTAAGATIKWDEDKLVRAMEAYGLCETTHSAHSTPEAGNGPADSAECAECVESSEGVGQGRADTRSEADEVESWPPEAREAFDERVAIKIADGIPLDEARRQALECVKREFGI